MKKKILIGLLVLISLAGMAFAAKKYGKIYYYYKGCGHTVEAGVSTNEKDATVERAGRCPSCEQRCDDEYGKVDRATYDKWCAPTN